MRPALVLFGIASLAITQPVLDLLGRNPEFFVAGRYDATQIIWTALVIAVTPGLIAAAIVGICWLIHPSAGAVAYSGALAVLVGLFGLVLLRSAGIDGLWPLAAGCAALAIAVVHLERTRRPVRTFLTYLSVGNLVFLGMFLVGSPTAGLVSGGTELSRGSVSIPPLDGPVVVVILDEFPVTTLMREDGTLNDARFPNFARLAESSTWFRNASSLSPMTHISVPSILTGRLPEGDTLPTYHDHDRNLLTLFGERHPVTRYEIVTNMCPPSICDPPPRGSLRQALEDSAVVYGHRVLPRELRQDLPSIDHSWGDFGDDTATPTATAAEPGTTTTTTMGDAFERWHRIGKQDRSAPGQSRIMDEMTALIDAEPSVNLIHVALPHFPWVLSPWGDRLMGIPRFTHDPTDPGYELAASQRYAVHSMQAGAADASVGRLVDHLQETGAWDNALVVVTSDHGLGLLPPDIGRTRTERNTEELLRVPLFIKAPHQDRPEIDDQPALTIDVLPTIIDLLGGRTDWELDGHSLVDGSEPTVDPVVEPDLRPALEIAARHMADTPHGDGWFGLAAVGEHGHLVGRDVNDVAVGAASSLSWRLDAADVLDSLPTDDGRVPRVLAGTVTTPDGGRPPDLVVAINGTLAGVVGAYKEADDGWRFTGFMGPAFRDGANEVVGYEVEYTSDGPVLHPVDTG